MKWKFDGVRYRACLLNRGCACLWISARGIEALNFRYKINGSMTEKERYLPGKQESCGNACECSIHSGSVMKKLNTFQEQVFVRTYRFDNKLLRLKKCGAKDWWRLSWWVGRTGSLLKMFWLERHNVEPRRDI